MNDLSKKKITGFILGMLIFLIPACSASKVMHETVERVNDGDTITLKGGEKVRYLGIDTPEIGFEEKPSEPFGREAAALNKELVLGRRVRLEVAKERRDRFGRFLAHVFSADDILVGEALLLAGLASCFPFEPHAYEKRFLKAQRLAMKQQKGRWYQWKEPNPQYTYIGNKRSQRFHRSDCHKAKTISRKNRVRYQTMWDAYFDGYAPAKGCLP